MKIDKLVYVKFKDLKYLKIYEKIALDNPFTNGFIVIRIWDFIGITVCDLQCESNYKLINGVPLEELIINNDKYRTLKLEQIIKKYNERKII